MSRSDPGLDSQVVNLEDEFFNKKHYFSYSGLQKLLYSPKLWYNHYIIGEREDRLDQHLIDGKVIHCLLLDNGNFEKQFIILPGRLPTGNNRVVIDKLFNLTRNTKSEKVLGEFDKEILEILKEIDLHQSLKTDAQRIEKIVTEESRSYYNYLAEKGNKDILDEETLARCQESVKILRNNKKVTQLLCLECDNSIDIYNELEIKVEAGDWPFGFKGIIDNLVIDRTNKVVYINDLKTSGKTLADFKETIEYYKYWLQAAIYIFMVKKYYNLDTSWKIKFTFIVIDKYLQVYPFVISEATMSIWNDRFLDAVLVANYHYENKSFDLPYEFCTNSVIL